MKVTINGKKMTIELDLDEARTPSASGKTLRVASTCGNMKTGVTVDGKELVIGVNAYIPAA